MSKRHSSNPGSRNRGGAQRRNHSGKRSNNNNGRRNGGGGGNISSVTASLNKYLEKAKDAQSAGDRVAAEYYFQHADHYTRILDVLVAERGERDEVVNQAETAAGEAESLEGNVGNSSSSQGESEEARGL